MSNGVINTTSPSSLRSYSLSLPLFNAPSYLYSLLLSASGIPALDPDLTLLIVQPYGAVLLSLTPSDFWSRWSRPATALVRRLFFYPCGGKEKLHVSIPCLFGLNAVAHFDVGKALVGERRVGGWFVLFGVLGETGCGPRPRHRSTVDFTADTLTATRFGTVASPPLQGRRHLWRRMSRTSTS